MVLVIEFPITKLQNKCFSWLGILVPTFDPGVKFLDILYVQTIFWLAFFFSPLLNIIAAIYYLITLYLKIVSFIIMYLFYYADYNSNRFLFVFCLSLVYGMRQNHSRRKKYDQDQMLHFSLYFF